MIVLQTKAEGVKRVTVVFTGTTGDLGTYFTPTALTNNSSSISSNSSDSVSVLEIWGRRLICENQDLVQEINAIVGNKLTINESSIATTPNEMGQVFNQRTLESISITMPSGKQYTFTPAPPPTKKGWW